LHTSLSIFAGNIAELNFPVCGGFIYDFGNLSGRRVGFQLLGIGDHTHHFIDQLVVGLMPARVKRPGEEIS
jgi:hypothetical protein